jgi:hypothetical protein
MRVEAVGLERSGKFSELLKRQTRWAGYGVKVVNRMAFPLGILGCDQLGMGSRLIPLH